MNLINKKLLQQKIHSFEFPTPEKLAKAKTLLEGWQRALKDSDLEKTKEKSIQGKFLSTFFEDILDYTDVTTGKEEYTLIQHPRIENDNKEPDGSLGWFTKGKKLTRAVIELKDAKTQLDKKQNRGSEKLTPVEQAYLYSTKYGGCNWIIVSNFKEIRLYNKNKTQEYYEKFDVMDLTQDSELKRFYYLLSQQNLISKDQSSVIDILAQDTTEAEQDITKKFYAEYKLIRLDLLGHLTAQNPSVSKEVLIEKTQKLLDRFIFTLFCEDTSTLLPLNLVKNTYERAMNSLSPSDERVWTEFKGLFLAIDKGNDRVKPPINAYNGGLFAFDEVLDNLSIKDVFWSNLMHLADYDFETDLNVNILGHIFEQSISDLEELKLKFLNVYENTNNGDIINVPQDLFVEKKGRRKKEGIFYTPEYITRYIVENTIGKYLEEHPDKLETIKILDPACGSGAFLNQAHSYLVKEYSNRYEALINEKLEKGESITLFDHNPAENNRKILLNNLYGVDLNQESVEITKLALWLKTARSTEPLQNLDKNIKNGNSLIDDPEIAGKKAFNWNTEFSEIMNDGGFDVIIGNPPYVPITQIDWNDRKYFQNKYTSAVGRFNLFYFFLELAKQQVKEGGYIGMIIPDRLLLNTQTEGLREFLLTQFDIVEILTIEEMVFEDAVVNSIIVILQNTKKRSSLVSKHIESELDLISSIEQKEIPYTYFKLSPSNQFDLNYNPDSEQLITKIKDRSLILSDIAEIKDGIIQSKIGDLLFLNSQQDDFSKPLLFGKDIVRYSIIFNGNYVNYNPEEMRKAEIERVGSTVVGLRLREPKIFERKKILTRQTADRIIGAIDEDNYYYANTLHGTHITDNRYSYEFVLGILNSKLMNWFYKTITSESGKVFAQVKIAILQKLPIPKPEMLESEEISSKVSNLGKLAQQQAKILSQANQFLSAEVGLTDDFLNIFTKGWNGLQEILNAKNVKLPVDKREELFNWFKSKQSELDGLHSQIVNIEKQIDQEIYKLYNLTEDEIKIIEDSL